MSIAANTTADANASARQTYVPTTQDHLGILTTLTTPA